MKLYVHHFTKDTIHLETLITKHLCERNGNDTKSYFSEQHCIDEQIKMQYFVPYLISTLLVEYECLKAEGCPKNRPSVRIEDCWYISSRTG